MAMPSSSRPIFSIFDLIPTADNTTSAVRVSAPFLPSISMWHISSATVTFLTVVDVRTVARSLRNERSMVFATSSSSRGIIWGIYSTTVTLTPNWANRHANSLPIAPEPTTTIDCGSRSITNACLDVITCLPSTSINGIWRGWAPVARMIASASYIVPSTSTLPWAAIRPKPFITSILFFFIRKATPLLMVSATVRERATIFSQSGVTSPSIPTP